MTVATKKAKTNATKAATRRAADLAVDWLCLASSVDAVELARRLVVAGERLDAYRENNEWVADKLAKLAADMDGELTPNLAEIPWWVATVRELRHALSDNPKLQP